MSCLTLKSIRKNGFFVLAIGTFIGSCSPVFDEAPMLATLEECEAQVCADDVSCCTPAWRASCAVALSRACPSLEPGATRKITLGPLAELSVIGLQPGCEDDPQGEFTSLWFAQMLDAYGSYISAGLQIGSIDHQPLFEGQVIEIPISGVVEGQVGRTVCVETDNTEENDDFLNERMSDDTDCTLVTATMSEFEFTLQPTYNPFTPAIIYCNSDADCPGSTCSAGVCGLDNDANICRLEIRVPAVFEDL